MATSETNNIENILNELSKEILNSHSLKKDLPDILARAQIKIKEFIKTPVADSMIINILEKLLYQEKTVTFQAKVEQLVELLKVKDPGNKTPEDFITKLF